MIETRIMQKGDVYKVQYRYTGFFKKWFCGWMDLKDKLAEPIVTNRGAIRPVKHFYHLDNARKAEEEFRKRMVPENINWRQVASNKKSIG